MRQSKLKSLEDLGPIGCLSLAPAEGLQAPALKYVTLDTQKSLLHGANEALRIIKTIIQSIRFYLARFFLQ